MNTQGNMEFPWRFGLTHQEYAFPWRFHTTPEVMIYPYGFNFTPQGNCWPQGYIPFLVVFVLLHQPLIAS
jgi:hypothetical protein